MLRLDVRRAVRADRVASGMRTAGGSVCMAKTDASTHRCSDAASGSDAFHQ